MHPVLNMCSEEIGLGVESLVVPLPREIYSADSNGQSETSVIGSLLPSFSQAVVFQIRVKISTTHAKPDRDVPFT